MLFIFIQDVVKWTFPYIVIKGIKKVLFWKKNCQQAPNALNVHTFWP